MEKRFPTSKRMVSTREAAELFSLATGTLQNWRSLKRGPRYYKTGKAIRYKLDDLEKFFTSTPVLTMDSLPEGQHG